MKGVDTVNVYPIKLLQLSRPIYVMRRIRACDLALREEHIQTATCIVDKLGRRASAFK